MNKDIVVRGLFSLFFVFFILFAGFAEGCAAPKKLEGYIVSKEYHEPFVTYIYAQSPSSNGYSIIQKGHPEVWLIEVAIKDGKNVSYLWDEVDEKEYHKIFKGNKIVVIKDDFSYSIDHTSFPQ